MSRTRSLAVFAALLVAGCSASNDGPEGDPIGVRSEKWTAPPCGAVMASSDGTSAKSNGAYMGTGSSCGGTGTYGLQYQCVELVMRHFMTHWKLRWYGNAKDLLVHAKSSSYYASGSPSQVEVWNNGDALHPPVAGDMIVWTSGTYGHVALVAGVRKGYVDIVEQNVSGVTPPGKYTLGFDGKTVAGRWGQAGPAGWAHAKANKPPVPDSGVVDSGTKDGGASDAAAGDAADDVGPEPDAPIDDAGLDPDGGLGDPSSAPPDEDAGPDGGAPAADGDTDLHGGCAYGRGSADEIALFAMVGIGILVRRRRRM